MTETSPVSRQCHRKAKPRIKNLPARYKQAFDNLIECNLPFKKVNERKIAMEMLVPLDELVAQDMTYNRMLFNVRSENKRAFNGMIVKEQVTVRVLVRSFIAFVTAQARNIRILKWSNKLDLLEREVTRWVKDTDQVQSVLKDSGQTQQSYVGKLMILATTIADQLQRNSANSHVVTSQAEQVFWNEIDLFKCGGSIDKKVANDADTSAKYIAQVLH